MTPRGHKISDDAHLALWSDKVPGRTTEEKIAYLLNFYAEARTIADAALAQTPPMQSDDLGIPYTTLPPDTITMSVDVYCKKCDAEGWMDLFFTGDGILTEAGVECPSCGYKKFGFVTPIPYFEGL